MEGTSGGAEAPFTPTETACTALLISNTKKKEEGTIMVQYK
jgi:hypothetical protein